MKILIACEYSGIARAMAEQWGNGLGKCEAAS